jgi:hypothetical protein
MGKFATEIGMHQPLDVPKPATAWYYDPMVNRWVDAEKGPTLVPKGRMQGQL